MNVEISRLRNIEEIDEVVDVFQQCGKGIDRELVLKYFHCGIITVARHNGHIIGCLLIADWRPLETMTWQRIIPSLRSDPAAESLEQMVVLDGYRNRGIGTEMVENAMAKISIIIRNPHSILPYDRWLAVSRLPSSRWVRARNGMQKGSVSWAETT